METKIAGILKMPQKMQLLSVQSCIQSFGSAAVLTEAERRKYFCFTCSARNASVRRFYLQGFEGIRSVGSRLSCYTIVFIFMSFLHSGSVCSLKILFLKHQNTIKGLRRNLRKWLQSYKGRRADWVSPEIQRGLVHLFSPPDGRWRLGGPAPACKRLYRAC